MIFRIGNLDKAVNGRVLSALRNVSTYISSAQFMDEDD